tara:strand:+ start:310 stop:585 length:276 start_codon:yes stop_codon:yes gene_type:complete
MTLKIEQNIPIPSIQKKCKYMSKARLMDIGDSVFIEAVKEDIGQFADYNRETRKTALNFANALRRLGMKSTMRIVRDDDGVLLGFRVWRVE